MAELTTMNPYWKRKWIAGLLSGKYARGTQWLRRPGHPDRFCCLGVLCDLVDSTRWRVTPTTMSYGDTSTRSYPPPEIRSVTGLSVAAVQKLSRLNDRAGYDFRDIANWIEKNL